MSCSGLYVNVHSHTPIIPVCESCVQCAHRHAHTDQAVRQTHGHCMEDLGECSVCKCACSASMSAPEPIENVGHIHTCACHTPAVGVEVAVDRYRGIAGFVFIIRLSERPCLKGISQRMMKWDIQCLFLDFVGTHVCIPHAYSTLHAHIHTHKWK